MPVDDVAVASRELRTDRSDRLRAYALADGTLALSETHTDHISHVAADDRGLAFHSNGVTNREFTRT